MFFSIVIPIYNVSRHIRRGFSSIEAQTFRDFEVIMIDDGSTDGSGGICDSLTDGKLDVNVIHQSNKGVGNARNVGIDNARGEYICFFDIDDILHPDALEILHRYLTHHTPQMLIFGYNEYETATGRTTGLQFHQAECRSNAEVRDIYVESLSGMITPNGFVWNKIYERRFLNDNHLRFEPLRIQQDEVFNLNVYPHLDRLMIVGDILYDYHVYHAGNATTSYFPGRLPVYRRVRDAFLELLRFWGLKDSRVESYIHRRFVNAFIYSAVNFTLFHPSNSLSPRRKREILAEWMNEPDIIASVSRYRCRAPRQGIIPWMYITAIRRRSLSLYNLARKLDSATFSLKRLLRH